MTQQNYPLQPVAEVNTEADTNVNKNRGTEAEAIRQQVRDYYGAAAVAASSGSTSAGCCTPVTLTPAGECCAPAPAGSEACCAPVAEGQSGCCTPAATSDVPVTTTADGARNYTPEELAAIDGDAAGFSLGCGNPTAIAGLRPGEVVLDLGSGGGLDAFLAARQVGETGFVYGVDMTEAMLERARRSAAKMGVSNVEFRKGNIEDIPLPGASVDVIISNCVVNLSPDKGQTLREAFRVLKPGGRLAISDIVIEGGLDDLPVSEAQVRTALSWAGCIAGALTIQQYTDLLAEAGFQDIAVTVRQRYSLEALGQDLESAAQHLPTEAVEALIGRFTSSTIEARRPD